MLYKFDLNAVPDHGCSGFATNKFWGGVGWSRASVPVPHQPLWTHVARTERLRCPFWSGILKPNLHENCTIYQNFDMLTE